MTLSTVDAQGMPRAPVLIVKAVDDRGWHFAVSSISQKGRDLAAHSVAALTFYWPALVRQVRIVGPVEYDGVGASADDFLARPEGSRAMALTRRQSQQLHDVAELDAEIDKAHRKFDDDPAIVPDEWMSYTVRASEVEFWQGSPDRRHFRLSYHRVGDSWEQTRLWPWHIRVTAGGKTTNRSNGPVILRPMKAHHLNCGTMALNRRALPSNRDAQVSRLAPVARRGT